MKLALIHGRDQQGKDLDELKNIWKYALQRGLKKNNLTLPIELEIVFPYYGDILDGLVRNEQVPDSVEGVIARGTLPNDQIAFYEDFLLDIAKNAAIEEKNIILKFEGPVQKRGPLNWEWIHTILRTLDLTPIGNLSIKRFTYDVFLYLTIQGIRRKINDYVKNEIGSGPCVVVGHSLGSIVGYNILRESTQLEVKKYITVGSPLGLRSIKSKLDTPISMPNCIKNGWFNAYDDRDVVALRPLDERYFGITPAIKNKNDVNNSTDNRHGIEGYLDDKEVAKVIYEALFY